MEDSILIMNCSVFNRAFNVSGDGTVGKESVEVMDFANVSDIIMVAFAIKALLSLKTLVNSSLVLEQFDKNRMKRLLGLIILLLMLPIVLVFLVCSMCYKVLCSVIIKRKDKHFVSFLDSFDVFWYLEGDSVINIMGVIECNSPETLVANMKLKLEDLFHNKTSDKIFYRRNEEYGFYYWRQSSFIDMSEYVEVLESPDKNELSETDLQDVIADVSRKSLPYDNEGLFKILITKQRVTNADNKREEYGIIFRIHHSVGDGVALINFLCKSLADNECKQSSNIIFNMPEFRNYGSADDLIKMIRKLCEIPLSIVDISLRTPDENSLHGPSLTGMKHFRWTESDENLLVMVKGIKDNVELNFFDVIATALAGSLNNYFHKTMTHVPEDVAVIIPIRLPSSSYSGNTDQNRFNNDFTISTLDVPVKHHRNLSKLKSRFADFRLSNEYLANHFILKLASIFPKQILKPIFYSSQATVTLSNMPGPDVLTICGGNVLKKMVFFLPLKGTTGVGVTAFCYGGVLRLAVSADTALVPSGADLDFILEGMVDEIRRMHQQYAKK